MSTDATGLPRLVLAGISPNAQIVAPPAMESGGGIPIPPQVQGRWITIGSGVDQDIQLRDEPLTIARSHLRMIRRGGVYLVQGRLHPSGYALNGERYYDCTARPLREGDRITLGQHVTLCFTLRPSA